MEYFQEYFALTTAVCWNFDKFSLKANQVILGIMAGWDKKGVSTSSKDDIFWTPSSAPAATAVGSGVDPALRDFLLAIKKDISDTIEASMNKINKRIEKNERDIASLKKKIETQDTELEGRLEGKLLQRIEKEIAKISPITAPTIPSIENFVPSSTGQGDAYCFSRRSLKMWPIVGENLKDAVKSFLCDKLKFSKQKINSLGLIEVRSFLGLANQLSGFIPDFAHMTVRLRELTLKKNAFLWLEDHEKEFKNVKTMLTSDMIVTFRSVSSCSDFDGCLTTPWPWVCHGTLY